MVLRGSFNHGSGKDDVTGQCEGSGEVWDVLTKAKRLSAAFKRSALLKDLVNKAQAGDLKMEADRLKAKIEKMHMTMKSKVSSLIFS